MPSLIFEIFAIVLAKATLMVAFLHFRLEKLAISCSEDGHDSDPQTASGSGITTCILENGSLRHLQVARFLRLAHWKIQLR